MKEDQNFPQRKKIRLEGYDYASEGAYFVTVCVKNKNVSLWQNVGADSIRPQAVCLSHAGKIVETAIGQISAHYENVVVDTYCIMPDHVHMIIFILPDGFDTSDGRMMPSGKVIPCSGRMISAPTISTVIGQMKRWASKQIGVPLWQKSFNDRILWNEKAYREAWKYIENNPLKKYFDTHGER